MISSPHSAPQASSETGPSARARGWLTARIAAFALVASVGVLSLAAESRSQTTAKAAPAKEAKDGKEVRGLEGSWSGGGSVQFATGGSEQARCKAFYSRASKDTYRLRATCATPSGKANQTATVHKVGENRYRGNFHNPDYDITGTIRCGERQQPERAAHQQQRLGHVPPESVTAPRGRSIERPRERPLRFIRAQRRASTSARSPCGSSR
jgi:hypothetical protein